MCMINLTCSNHEDLIYFFGVAQIWNEEGDAFTHLDSIWIYLKSWIRVVTDHQRSGPLQTAPCTGS